MDTNGDGELTLEEYKTISNNPGTKSAFEKVDADGDGLVTFAEFGPRYEEFREAAGAKSNAAP
jgi:hypothetical protein